VSKHIRFHDNITYSFWRILPDARQRRGLVGNFSRAHYQSLAYLPNFIEAGQAVLDPCRAEEIANKPV